MSQSSLSQSLLNAILVLAESAMTMVLRFDPSLRKTVYPLAKQETLVIVRTYLPHTQVYATFTTKGVLLDSKPFDPTREPDVVINTYTHQFAQAIISNDVRQIDKITMRGDAETVAQVRAFLTRLGVASLYQGILKTVKGKTKKDDGKDSDTTKAEPNYRMQVAEQQKQLNALTIRNRELEISLKEAKVSKNHVIALIVASLVAVLGVILGVRCYLIYPINPPKCPIIPAPC